MQAVQLCLEQQFMFLIYIDLLLKRYRLRTPRRRRDFRRDAQWADYVRRLPKGCLCERKAHRTVRASPFACGTDCRHQVQERSQKHATISTLTTVTILFTAGLPSETGLPGRVDKFAESHIVRANTALRDCKKVYGHREGRCCSVPAAMASQVSITRRIDQTT